MMHTGYGYSGRPRELQTGPLGQSPHQDGLRGSQIAAAGLNLALPNQAQTLAGATEVLRQEGMTRNTATHEGRVQAQGYLADQAAQWCCYAGKLNAIGKHGLPTDYLQALPSVMGFSGAS